MSLRYTPNKCKMMAKKREPYYEMPDMIPDTPENVARAIMRRRPPRRKKCVVCKGRTARVRVSHVDGTHRDICGRRDMNTGVFEPSRCMSYLSLKPAKIEQL